MIALNGIWSDIYILQIIIPARIRKVDRLFGDELDFENIKFQVKFKDIHFKWKKRILLALVTLVTKIR